MVLFSLLTACSGDADYFITVEVPGDETHQSASSSGSAPQDDHVRRTFHTGPSSATSGTGGTAGTGGAGGTDGSGGSGGQGGQGGSEPEPITVKCQVKSNAQIYECSPEAWFYITYGEDFCDWNMKPRDYVVCNVGTACLVVMKDAPWVKKDGVCL